MNTLLGLTSTIVDVYNGKVEDLGLSPFFMVDKGWKDEEVLYLKLVYDCLISYPRLVSFANLE